MWDDPIVEETRKRREEYAEEFGWDLDAIYRDLQEHARTLPNPPAEPRPPRRPLDEPHAA
jgi:hypothetical protein